MYRLIWWQQLLWTCNWIHPICLTWMLFKHVLLYEHWKQYPDPHVNLLLRLQQQNYWHKFYFFEMSFKTHLTIFAQAQKNYFCNTWQLLFYCSWWRINHNDNYIIMYIIHHIIKTYVCCVHTILNIKPVLNFVAKLFWYYATWVIY